MDYKELLEKYNILLEEKKRLSEENSQLKALLGPAKLSPSPKTGHQIIKNECADELAEKYCFSSVDSKSDTVSKIRLFMSLFKGREDVYAKRWENKSKGTSGYSPVCRNQWQKGLCGKPSIPCSKCENRSYAALDDEVVENHLRGNLVVGIYPMCPDETCCFLAVDFDKAEWQNDISALRDVCTEYKIPIAVERSRSGKGGHLWFFFKNRISVALARKFGTALLTCAMCKRHEIQFKSYDRLFPSQDTMPKGGLGNLIALPLQKSARENANSEFIDENFQAHDDQWAFLASIQKLSENRLDYLIMELCSGHELGELIIDPEEEERKPWETKKRGLRLQSSDFPKKLDIVKANMLFIPKAAISQPALNKLKRLASFKNPMFHRHQAMRLPTYGHPRVHNPLASIQSAISVHTIYGLNNRYFYRLNHRVLQRDTAYH
jgi:hypothetical protein